MICGTLHGDGFGAPEDPHGCILPVNHGGEPHEFIAADGVTYQWETDLECDCDHCMKCEGDYCTTYWRKNRAAAQGPAGQHDAAMSAQQGQGGGDAARAQRNG